MQCFDAACIEFCSTTSPLSALQLQTRCKLLLGRKPQQQAMCPQAVVQYSAYQVEIFLPAKSAFVAKGAQVEEILFGIVDTDWHEFSTLYLCDGGSQATFTVLVG